MGSSHGPPNDRLDTIPPHPCAFTTGATAFVTRLYQQVLNRTPDAAGLQGFLAQIQQFRLLRCVAP